MAASPNNISDEKVEKNLTCKNSFLFFHICNVILKTFSQLTHDLKHNCHHFNCSIIMPNRFINDQDEIIIRKCASQIHPHNLFPLRKMWRNKGWCWLAKAHIDENQTEYPRRRNTYSDEGCFVYISIIDVFESLSLHFK